MLCSLGEIYGTADGMFLGQFSRREFSKYGRSRRKQPCMENSDRAGIDCGIQPILLIVDLNYGFIECNVVLIRVSCQLQTGFLYPIMSGLA